MIRDKFTRAYIYCADIYCLGCGEDLPLIDPENNERRAVASWELSEFDAATTCGGCHTILSGGGEYMNVNDLAMVSSDNANTLIRAELAQCFNGDGLDGVALDLVKAMAGANGELFTDGECLDMIGRIVDNWRATDLDA